MSCVVEIELIPWMFTFLLCLLIGVEVCNNIVVVLQVSAAAGLCFHYKTSEANFTPISAPFYNHNHNHNHKVNQLTQRVTSGLQL